MGLEFIMFAYARAAIDWWPGWLTESEFKKQLVEIYTADDAARALAEYDKRLETARELASRRNSNVADQSCRRHRRDDHDEHDRQVGQNNSAGIVPESPGELRVNFAGRPT
jgi:hypothetical protein